MWWPFKRKERKIWLAFDAKMLVDLVSDRLAEEVGGQWPEVMTDAVRLAVDRALATADVPLLMSQAIDYWVDRRIVKQQAFEEAQKLVRAVDWRPLIERAIVQEVKETAKRLHIDDQPVAGFIKGQIERG